MTLSALLAWLDAHALTLATVLGAVAAAWKAIPQDTRARIEARFPRIAGLARFVAMVGPDVLGAARVARHQIAAGRSRVVTPPVLPDLPRAQGGHAAPLAMGCAALGALALVLAGCPLPRPDGCTPRATRCAPDGVPEVCSQSQRWTRGAPSEPCPAGSVCCATVGAFARELHACVPASACAVDAGTEGGAR